MGDNIESPPSRRITKSPSATSSADDTILVAPIEKASPRERQGQANSSARQDWLGACLFEQSPLGIAVLDSTGCIIVGNAVLADILQRTPEEVSGLRLVDAVALEDRDDVAAQLGKLVLGTVPRIALDHVRMTQRRGSERAVAFYGMRVTYELGADRHHACRLLVQLLDVTQLRTLQLRFTQAQKLEVLGQLASGIAHDFNNLITAILGSCDLLLGHGVCTATKADDDLQQIRSTALRARDLVGQLLTFARRQPQRPALVSPARAIDSMLPMLRRLLGSGITVRVHRADLDRLVRMDPSQLDQIVVNLAANARDAMPNGGTLSLRTSYINLPDPMQRAAEIVPAGAYVVLEVHDSGVGIPREIIAEIFEPFFTTKEGTGTGLGLAMVYGIVRQNGGFVFVESAVGAGASFIIYLPEITLGPSPSAHPPLARELGHMVGDGNGTRTTPERSVGFEQTPSALKRPLQTVRGTVLLVEDEAAIRRFAARALMGRGHRVIEAADAETALSALQAPGGTIDLLITDLSLPDMDGRELIAWARKWLPSLPMIVISAYADDLRELATDSPIQLLPKPFTLAELADAVDLRLARGL